MTKEMTGLKFFFRSGEYWLVDRKLIGDVWISHITTSIGRINGGKFQEIHPCESFKIEILPEADHVQSENINFGGLESGMFERVKKYSDIEFMEIMYAKSNEQENKKVSINQVYFPYEAQDADGIDNQYQSTKIGENGNLYIVIDYHKNVADFF